MGWWWILLFQVLDIMGLEIGLQKSSLQIMKLQGKVLACVGICGFELDRISYERSHRVLAIDSWINVPQLKPSNPLMPTVNQYQFVDEKWWEIVNCTLYLGYFDWVKFYILVKSVIFHVQLPGCNLPGIFMSMLCCACMIWVTEVCVNEGFECTVRMLLFMIEFRFMLSVMRGFQSWAG